jgi:hypothetical protein
MGSDVVEVVEKLPDPYSYKVLSWWSFIPLQLELCSPIVFTAGLQHKCVLLTSPLHTRGLHIYHK